eukprot:CAMPEP_0182424328 /NCGR_PEP_ID=MMETSP1167-20130531/10529_1 /TAXON_ID=2988 /ORGANISM="Mallomonas Sp, Strain CCMP3275" /LENGTH=801 /DNA_ID=CAMNT_0024604061 /DNA_START=446 /DNA_END=2851 /DNA_ORIENTATION=-
MSRPFNYRCPRILLLSSFFTWAGGDSDSKILSGSWSDFKIRSPTICAAEEYLLENSFYHMLRSSGLDGCIVGMGLVYGGSGYDMEELFRTMWSADSSTSTPVLSTTEGESVVPMIHFQDLADLLLHLVEGGCASLNASLESPVVFIPATDLSTTSMKKIFEIASHTTRSNSHFTSQAEAMEVLLIHPQRMKWICDFPSFTGDMYEALHFELHFESGMSAHFPEMWQEFLTAHSLELCTVIIAGPPRVHKSNLALSISSNLEVPYIDVSGAIKYVMAALESPSTATDKAVTNKEVKSREGAKRSAKSPALSAEKSIRGDIVSVTTGVPSDDKKELSPPLFLPDPTKAMSTELLKSVKKRLEKALESSQKNNKKFKDEITENNPYPDVLCRTLPAPLVRLCLSATIRSDLDCLRRGYVLDAWDWAVQGLADMKQVVGDKDKDDFVLDPALSSTTTSYGSQQGSRPGTSQSIRYQYPEMLIEITTPDNIVINKLQCTLLGLPIGSPMPPKFPKEHMAAVKELESRQTTYNALMELLDKSETPVNNDMSHKGVIELADHVHIVRVDTMIVSIDQITTDTRGYMEKKHGPIGWLNPKPLLKYNNAKSIMYEDGFIVGKPLEIIPGKEMSGADSPFPFSANSPFSPNPLMRQMSAGQEKWSASSLETKYTEKATAGSMRGLRGGSETMISISGDGEKSALLPPIPPKRNEIEVINENINRLEGKDQQTVLTHCGVYQDFLVNNVLPHIAEAMIIIAKDKPEDPIGFLANFLSTRGEQLEKDACAQALEKFQEALSLAEELDRDFEIE